MQLCEIVGAIKAFAHRRIVSHCGATFAVSPFDLYLASPHCGERIKLRSFSAIAELEDVFDAVFEWMLSEGGADLARRRQKAIQEDLDE